MLGLQNDREWRGFCELVMKAPELAEDPRFVTNSKRSANRVELNSLIRKVFSQLVLADVTGRLDDAGIANAAVNDMRQVWEHPQLSARDRWFEVMTPAGEVPALKAPGLWFAEATSAVPSVGEHTRPILQTLGYSDEQIEQFERVGVV